MDSEARKSIMETFLRSIHQLSDEEYQQRVWVEGRGPECDSYSEFYNYFFCQGDDVILNYKDYGITDAQHQLLKKLEDELDAFDREMIKDDSKSEYELLTKYPEWRNIMSIAKEALEAFNYKPKSKDHNAPNSSS